VRGANLSGHSAVGVLGAALAAKEAAQGLVHSQVEHARLGSCVVQSPQSHAHTITNTHAGTHTHTHTVT
jgi:hypothetical protein